NSSQRAAMTTPLRIERYDHRGAIRALTSSWERIAARNPFSSPAWSALAAAHLSRPPRQLRLIAAFRGSSLVAVLPLLPERRSGVRGSPPLRVLRSLSDDHSQRFDLVGDPVALPAIWRHLTTNEPWDALELRDLPPGAAAATLVDLARAEGLLVG